MKKSIKFVFLFFQIDTKNPNNEILCQSLASKMYVPGSITPLSLRSLYFARNSGPPDNAYSPKCELEIWCTPIVPNFKAPVLPKRWDSNNSDRAPKIPNFWTSASNLSHRFQTWDYELIIWPSVQKLSLNHFQKVSSAPYEQWPVFGQNLDKISSFWSKPHF